jgi:hypothetical protein
MLRDVGFFRAEQPCCVLFAGRWGMQFDLDDPRTLRPWLIEHFCPFWLARIRDPAGDFLEVLGTPVVSPRRNTLSQARLTYVFSHAAIRCSAKPPVTARTPDGGWFRTVPVDRCAAQCDLWLEWYGDGAALHAGRRPQARTRSYGKACSPERNYNIYSRTQAGGAGRRAKI